MQPSQRLDRLARAKHRSSDGKIQATLPPAGFAVSRWSRRPIYSRRCRLSQAPQLLSLEMQGNGAMDNSGPAAA